MDSYHSIKLIIIVYVKGNLLQSINNINRIFAKSFIVALRCDTIGNSGNSKANGICLSIITRHLENTRIQLTISCLWRILKVNRTQREQTIEKQ